MRGTESSKNKIETAKPGSEGRRRTTQNIEVRSERSVKQPKQHTVIISIIGSREISAQSITEFPQTKILLPVSNTYQSI